MTWLQQLPEPVKVAADVVAVPTAFIGGLSVALGIIQTVVGIAAAALAGIYTVYRIIDLRDQRRARREAEGDCPKFHEHKD